MVVVDNEKVTKVDDIISVPLNKIDEYFNVRVRDSEISELMTSIKNKGLINPVTLCEKYPVTKDSKDKGRYYIIAGHRRKKAHEKLLFKKIDATVKKMPIEEFKKNFMILNLVENFHREDNTILELHNVIREFKSMGYNLKEISSLIDVPYKKIKDLNDSFHRIPETYRKYFKTLDNSEERKTKKVIPYSMMKDLSRFIGKKSEKDKLFQWVLNSKPQKKEVSEVVKLMNQKIPFDKSVKLVGNYEVVSFHLFVKRDKFKELLKVHRNYTEIFKMIFSKAGYKDYFY